MTGAQAASGARSAGAAIASATASGSTSASAAAASATSARPARPGARTEAALAALTGLDDAALHALLRRRPDLAVPPPASFGALAARAVSRPSVDRALAGLDRHVLDVAEAVCALHPLGPLDEQAVALGVGADPAAALGVLTDLLLVIDGVPLQTLTEALGPAPAGLGTPLAELAPGATVPDPASLHERLDDAPDAARRVLDALRDGPPVGVVGRGAAASGSQWLLDHEILHPLEGDQVTLPLETALLLRGGRTHPAAQPVPPVLTGPTRPAAAVAAESARAAEEIVRRVELVVRRWAQDPAPALRSGGLGVRELARVATALEVPPHEAATVLEIAAAAGLVGDGEDREGTVFLTTTPEAAGWLEAELAPRWAELATAWLESRRAAWLVGERDERGTRLAALGPGLDRGWAARLRRRVLDALTQQPAGLAPSADELHALLTWSRPRATPDSAATVAVLDEAALLGVTGAGALSSAGRALLDAGQAPPDERHAAVVAALAEDLPAPVAEIIIQGDLTAVVPGRPTPGLAELLDLSSQVESRGAGLTVRFTAETLRHALDSGLEPDDLLARLTAASRTPLPQALEYLVGDVGRRHGRLRVGAATSYLRTHDETATREVLADPRFAPLGLREIAPTVLVSSLPPASLARMLEEAGGSPVLEGSIGSLAGSRRDRQPALRIAPRSQSDVRVRTLDDATVTELVAKLRGGHRSGASSGSDATAADPGHAVALLRDAAASGSAVSIVVVGPSGAVQRRRVRPLSVDGGRARLLDLDRERSIVVAVHRISAVSTGR